MDEIADASPAAPPAPREKISPAGWLADEPELADELERLMAEVRAKGRVRAFDDEKPG